MWCDFLLAAGLGTTLWKPLFHLYPPECYVTGAWVLEDECWQGYTDHCIDRSTEVPLYFILGLVFYAPVLYLGDSSCSSRIVLPSFFTQHICLMIHEITKELNFFASFCLSDSDYKWAKISPLRFRAVFTGRELLGARSHLGEWAGFARFLF